MTDDTPDKLDKQIDKASKAVERLNAEAEALVEGESSSTALVPLTESAEAARSALAQRRAAATKIRAQVVKETKRVQELQRRKVALMEREMKREIEKMNRMMAPLQDQLKRLEEAVWTVNLYLGRDEQIVRLSEGKTAPAETPVVVRQLVLAMDQECAVASEHGGIDSLNYHHFDSWLQEDWAHVEQVIPEEKGVVALVPRYNSDPKFYDDPNLTEQAMIGNDQTYFLIRNGRNVYRTWTKFQIGTRLVPASDEFTRYFKRPMRHFGQDGEALDSEYLQPGEKAWAKAEQAASFRQRQYMRVALILEGLLHRTTVFHPLPAAGISFTDQQHHAAGRVRFVLDAERLLGSGDQLPPFNDWLANLSGQLRPGMRIVGNFSGQGWRHANENRGEYRDRYGHSRVRPNNAEGPETNTIYRIESREPNGDLLIRYKRTQEVYDKSLWVETRPGWGYRGGYKIPKNRASAIIRPGDDFVIALDLVTIEECERYLNSRLERHNYTTMFPVLKAVLRAKRAEEAIEEPFREMMVGVLMRETGENEQAVRAALPDLVQWFKLGNRVHRPLVHGTIDEATAKAAGIDPEDIELVMTDPATGNADASKPVRFILDEYKRRLRDAKRDHSADIIAGLRAMHRDALLVARTRTGRYLVLTPEDDRNIFTRERQYTAKAELREDKRWVLPGTRVSRWTILFESERWSEWDLSATKTDHLTGPEQEEFFAEAQRDWAEKYAINEDNTDKAILGKPAAVTSRSKREDYSDSDNPRTSVEIWSLGYSSRFRSAWNDDDEDANQSGILTGDAGATEPAFHSTEYRWRRKSDRVQVYRYDTSESGWKAKWQDFADDEFAEGAKPWSADRYNKNRSPIWEDDGQSIARYLELAEVRGQYNKERNALLKIVEQAVHSLKLQWLQPRYDKIYRRFLEDYHDPDLWEGHLKANPKLLPEWKHTSGRFSGESDPAYLRALHALVEKGVMPWGMTVRETVKLAQDDERFNYVWTWSEQRVKHKPPPGSDDMYVSQSSSDPIAPRELWKTHIPRDIADLTYLEEFELVKPWPEVIEEVEEELDDDWDDEDDDDLEPELGEDYDVEATAEEDSLPALEERTADR